MIMLVNERVPLILNILTVRGTDCMVSLPSILSFLKLVIVSLTLLQISQQQLLVEDKTFIPKLLISKKMLT